MESYDYDSIPLLALVAAVVVALIAHLARMSRLVMTSAPVAILAALPLKTNKLIWRLKMLLQ